MKLPAGTDGGTIASPQDEKFFTELTTLRGAVEIRIYGGSGFILVDHGKLQAAMFQTADELHKGRAALSFMTTGAGETKDPQPVHLRRYTDEEYLRALDLCRESNLLVAYDDVFPPVAGDTSARQDGARGPEPRPLYKLDEDRLKKILIQPGVIAVSAFFEGFPVQSIGKADFEKVAASAEDFMRAGVKIAEEMNAGPLEQMILETADNKFIIAPCGDLFICVFTTADTQLGLIRVIIRSIQSEMY